MPGLVSSERVVVADEPQLRPQLIRNDKTTTPDLKELRVLIILRNAVLNSRAPLRSHQTLHLGIYRRKTPVAPKDQYSYAPKLLHALRRREVSSNPRYRLPYTLLTEPPPRLTSRSFLDMGTASELRSPVAVLPPVSGGGDRCDEPEQSAGQVHPDGVLHALDAPDALGVLLDVHLDAVSWHVRAVGLLACAYITKEPEERDPQDEEDEVPDGRYEAADAQDQGDEVDEACHGGQHADHDGIDLDQHDQSLCSTPAYGAEGALTHLPSLWT